MTGALGCGSMLTACVAPVRLGWTLTMPGGPECGSACTFAGGTGLAGWRRNQVAAAAPTQAAASSASTNWIGRWNGARPATMTDGDVASAVSTLMAWARSEAANTEVPAPGGTAVGR